MMATLRCKKAVDSETTAFQLRTAAAQSVK